MDIQLIKVSSIPNKTFGHCGHISIKIRGFTIKGKPHGFTEINKIFFLNRNICGLNEKKTFTESPTRCLFSINVRDVTLVSVLDSLVDSLKEGLFNLLQYTRTHRNLTDEVPKYSNKRLRSRRKVCSFETLLPYNEKYTVEGLKRFLIIQI